MEMSLSSRRSVRYWANMAVTWITVFNTSLFIYISVWETLWRSVGLHCFLIDYIQRLDKIWSRNIHQVSSASGSDFSPGRELIFLYKFYWSPGSFSSRIDLSAPAAAGLEVAMIAGEYLIRACCLCVTDLHENMGSWGSVSMIQLPSPSIGGYLLAGALLRASTGLLLGHSTVQFFTLPLMQIWVVPISTIPRAAEPKCNEKLSPKFNDSRKKHLSIIHAIAWLFFFFANANIFCNDCLYRCCQKCV